MKVNVQAHVLYRKDYNDERDFRLAMFPMESCGFVTIDMQIFEVEIPDDFDPRSKQIETLLKEKNRISAEFSLRVTQIDEQINRLTAIEA